MSQNIIEIKNLEKSFKHHKVIRNISMSVPEGSVYGLLGPNGAGKSTILKMLTGLLRPDSGRILFCGTPWTRKNLEETGSLIETPPVYENLSAWENLKVRALILGETEERIKEVLEMVNLTDTGKKPAGKFSLGMKQLSAWENLKVRALILGETEERIKEVLEMVNLTDTGKKPAGKFSLGMKQRLGIAIALLGHPRLLILDEPVNGLDPLGIQEIRGLIRSFADKGMTVMISSHILSEIQQTADHIGILVNGKMGYEGPVTEDMNLESLFMKIAAAEREVG